MESLVAAWRSRAACVGELAQCHSELWSFKSLADIALAEPLRGVLFSSDRMLQLIANMRSDVPERHDDAVIQAQSQLKGFMGAHGMDSNGHVRHWACLFSAILPGLVERLAGTALLGRVTEVHPRDVVGVETSNATAQLFADAASCVLSILREIAYDHRWQMGWVPLDEALGSARERWAHVYGNRAFPIRDTIGLQYVLLEVDRLNRFQFIDHSIRGLCGLSASIRASYCFKDPLANSDVLRCHFRLSAEQLRLLALLLRRPRSVTRLTFFEHVENPLQWARQCSTDGGRHCAGFRPFILLFPTPFLRSVLEFEADDDDAARGGTEGPLEDPDAQRLEDLLAAGGVSSGAEELGTSQRVGAAVLFSKLRGVFAPFSDTYLLYLLTECLCSVAAIASDASRERRWAAWTVRGDHARVVFDVLHSATLLLYQRSTVEELEALEETTDITFRAAAGPTPGAAGQWMSMYGRGGWREVCSGPSTGARLKLCPAVWTGDIPAASPAVGPSREKVKFPLSETLQAIQAWCAADPVAGEALLVPTPMHPPGSTESFVDRRSALAAIRRYVINLQGRSCPPFPTYSSDGTGDEAIGLGDAHLMGRVFFLDPPNIPFAATEWRIVRIVSFQEVQREVMSAVPLPIPDHLLFKALCPTANETLEYLGDAVVDYTVMRRLVRERRYEDGTSTAATHFAERGISRLLSAITTNDSLGRCCPPSIQLHLKFRFQLEHPKSRGDVLEAIAGALFRSAVLERRDHTDAALNETFDAVEHMLDRLGVFAQHDAPPQQLC
jgi:hypothetical protein